jgi:hypothetical protein
MEESEMVCFYGGVHTKLSKAVLRETVYMPYSAAPSLIAVNVKVGIASIGCCNMRNGILLEVLKTHICLMETKNMVASMHERRIGVRDVVAMVLPAAERCAAYLAEHNSYLCYRMQRRLNNLGVPWVCRQDWGGIW